MQAQKKSVLITGCSSGFGKRTAVLLKENGWEVYATARKPEDIDLLRREGFKSFFLDLADGDSIRCLVRDVLNASGGTLSALVNNAGSTVLGALEDLPRENLREQFETNFFGPLELTRLLLPVFRRQKSAKIVFITSSDNNNFAFPFLGAEAASKNALATACNALRRELWGSAISVSTLCPGPFHTPIIKKSLSRFSSMHFPGTVHKEAYRKLVDFLSSQSLHSGDDRVIIVARAVLKLLESRRPARNIAVPFIARLHYAAHRYLPDSALDFLLYLKMRFTYKII